MNWSLKLAWRRLMLNKKANALLVLQIFIGAAILYGSMSVESSCSLKLKQDAESVANNIVTISESAGVGEQAMNLDDYYYIREEWSSFGYEALFSLETAVYIEIGSIQRRVPILFVSDNYGQLMMDLPALSADGYYFGEKIGTILQNSPFVVTYGVYAFDAQEQALFGHPIQEYQILHTGIRSQTARSQYANVYSDDDYSFANSVFVPLSCLGQYSSEVNGTAYIYLVPSTVQVADIDSACQSIIEELCKRHPGSTFDYHNDLRDIQLRSTELMRNALLFQTIATAMLIILSFELVGQFMLIVYRRQRSYAISRMCGANVRQLICELFLEIWLLSSSGALSAMALTTLILPSFSPPLYTISGSFHAFGETYGVFIAIMVVTTISCISTIVSSSPINILRNSNE